MSEKSIDQNKLNEFMNDSWSYPNGSGKVIVSGGNDKLVDIETGKEYALYVENGKLSMSEVTE